MSKPLIPGLDPPIEDQTRYVHECPHKLILRARDQCPFCRADCICCEYCRKRCEHDPRDMALAVLRR